MSNYYGTRRSISYTPRELIYKMFRKKSCPICGQNMISTFKEQYEGIKYSEGAQGAPWESKSFEIIQCYYCGKCNKTFAISELIKDEKDIKHIPDDDNNDDGDCLHCGD